MTEDVDAALADLLTAGDERLLTREQLQKRTGVSDAVLDVAEREGFVVARTSADGSRYTEADARTIAAGVTLIEAGVPLGELLALARTFDTTMGAVAEDAVELFARFVRDPALVGDTGAEDVGVELVDAVETMLPATSAIVAERFRRLVISRAVERLEDDEEGSA